MPKGSWKAVSRKSFSAVIVAAALLLQAGFPMAPLPWTKPSISVSAAEYDGPCPAILTFEAEVRRPPLPGPLRYRFIRSDGVVGPLEEAKFLGSNKATLTYTWRLGRDYEGWVLLKIISPRTVISDKAVFNFRCRSRGADGPEIPSSSETSPPVKFFLDFSDLQIACVPSSRALMLSAENTILSQGEEWEVCALKPYIYHLRHKDWQSCYWQVNTSRWEMIEIRRGTFCDVSSGIRSKLDCVVEVEGPGGESEPLRFLARFPKATMTYVPETDQLQILEGSTVLSNGENWDRCAIAPDLFHLRLKAWPDFFWKVDTARQQAAMVSNGTFCLAGGTENPLNTGVRVVD